jgi:predicted NBD/HSP70 family sugar kinase
MPESPTGRVILGWDVGGTTSSAVVGTAGGDILEQETWPSHAETGPQVMIYTAS